MSGERPPYPAELDVLRARLEQHALEQHVALPGRVQSYDAATQKIGRASCRERVSSPV